MKPMLASSTNGKGLRYPLLVSPKLDGIRCIIIDGVATSRKLKPIPNLHVQKLFGKVNLNGFDGELIVGPPNARDVYRRTSSGVMSVHEEPDVHFYVFDNYKAAGGFTTRLGRVRGLDSVRFREKAWTALEHHLCHEEVDLNNYEEDFVEQGFEGIMVRSMEGPYKHGRSTEKEGWLLKLKRFEDSEAIILGMQELMINTNERKLNELGKMARTSHQAGKVAADKLGALSVRDVKTGVEFEIGTGFTERDRTTMWNLPEEMFLGRVVKYKFQPVGVKDKPRFPVFLGFRDERDM